MPNYSCPTTTRQLWIPSEDVCFAFKFLTLLVLLLADWVKKFLSLSGAMNIYQPVLRHNNFAKAPDTHFARDTHMRIILGNTSTPFGKDKKPEQENTNSKARWEDFYQYCYKNQITRSCIDISREYDICKHFWFNTSVLFVNVTIKILTCTKAFYNDFILTQYFLSFNVCLIAAIRNPRGMAL